MADQYGVNYTNYNSVPRKFVGVDQWGGRVRVLSDSIASATTAAATDKIYLGRLPKGATIVQTLVGGNAGANTTAYFAGPSDSETSIWTGTPGTTGALAQYGDVSTSGEVDVYVKNTSAISAKAVKIQVLYVVD